MDNKEIIDLYSLYGFNLEQEDELIMAFSFSNGYFNNIEIVYSDGANYQRLKDEYEQIGYSVSIVQRKDIDAIHNRLFSGFFNIQSVKNKIRNDYQTFCSKQKEKLLDNDYEYLICDYLLNNSFFESSVVNTIFKKLNDESAQMIILEAAAGYGKTCTAYEVLKMFSDQQIKRIPLITELSKNRKASIFRYVLLSEIDRQFSTLSSKVVEYEIKNGRVPLIIDGFDELLSKTANTDNIASDEFGEVQGMLDTIALLLDKQSKAKILITSRKSAIFTGQQFDEWVESRDLAACITRIELRPPKIKDWIGAEKIEALRAKNMDVEYISNPILLSLLRFKDVAYISNNSLSSIIDDYLSTLLSREKERQSLYLDKEEQLNIMYRLAAYFADFNITAEDSDFIKSLILDITRDMMDTYLSRYKNYLQQDIESQPTDDEFAMKLVHHALLDRRFSGKNQIGFINDFFFGLFLGQALLNNFISEKDVLDYKFVDLIATAFAVSDIEIKQRIEGIIVPLLSNYSDMQQLEISNKLFHKNICSYKDQYFSNMVFSNGFHFDGNLTIQNCIFTNCVFDDCYMNRDSFRECQFYNCNFYNIHIDYENRDSSPSRLMFLECKGYEEISNAFDVIEAKDEDNQEIDFKKILLEQFWKIGSLNPEPRRAFTAIYRGVGNSNISNIDVALKELLKEKILIKKNYCYELNYNKMKEIKNILGRE